MNLGLFYSSNIPQSQEVKPIKLVSISFSKYRLLVRFIHILSQDYTLGYHVLFSIHYNLFINYQPHDSRQLGMSQWQNRHFSLIPKKTLEVIFLYFYCLSVRFIRRPYQATLGYLVLFCKYVLSFVYELQATWQPMVLTLTSISSNMGHLQSHHAILLES